RTMDPLRLPAGSAVLTSDFRLFGNFPNPFNPGTTLAFFLAKPLRVNLTVYDILGQSVTTLVSGRLDAGNHRVYWDGRNSIGNEVSAGIYYYQLSAGNRSQTRKMILLR
ncbi:MAG TPA: T9SS type A sorting domain-containing protein, partial [Caldithrix sp.]|nr:T9SS type A sorting domain-containing protein [Caldithrix sp.]